MYAKKKTDPFGFRTLVVLEGELRSGLDMRCAGGGPATGLVHPQGELWPRPPRSTLAGRSELGKIYILFVIFRCTVKVDIILILKNKSFKKHIVASLFSRKKKAYTWFPA